VTVVVLIRLLWSTVREGLREMESINNSVAVPSVSGGSHADSGTEAFAAFVTGTAFDLRLSKNMVRALSQFDYAGVCIETFMTVSSLRCRGLITSTKDGWKITEAGAIVVQLLKLAGVYEDYEAFKDRMGLSNV